LMSRINATVGYANMTLIPGFFNESLTAGLRDRFEFQPALVVDIDVDLYVSAMHCLTWMFEQRLVVEGTIIRYDDWRNMHQRHGEARAHGEITKRFNVTWHNLGQPGTMNQREWVVARIGDAQVGET